MEEFLDVEIESLNTSGDGVARVGRQHLIVPFTIPGERVRVRRDASRRAWTVAEILHASPHRVTPRCSHFGPASLRLRRNPAGAPGADDGPCGGCGWQHIAYPEQLRLKTALVTRLVQAAVPHAPAAHPMLPGTSIDDPWGYRHKVHFVFGSSGHGRPAAMGHYMRGSRRVIRVRECPVHHERGNAFAFRLRDAYHQAQVAAAPDGPLKGIALRVGARSPELMGTLVLTDDIDKAVRAATRRLLAAPDAPSSFHLNLHPRTDAFIFGRETRTVMGPARMREEVAGVAFLISPTAFFQTNIHAAEILVRIVLDTIPDHSRVLDLYAGAGLFALPLARAGCDVVAIEENREAVGDGDASRRLNRIAERRCRFIARRVEQALPLHERDRPFDAVVLDPPREGCSPAVIERLFGTLAPPLAVYVSCNPEALARDLAAIARLNYRIRSMQPVDMFPHTAHVETVAVVTR